MASIYRRGTVWWGRAQRSGRELRVSLETASERTAQRRLQAWLDELGRTKWGERPRRTFDDMALYFLERHLPTLRPSSARRYRASIEVLMGTFSGLPLEAIGSAKLSEFVATRRESGTRPSGRKRQKKGGILPDEPTQQGRPLRMATIRRDLACLSSMFGLAMEWEWLESNPVPAFMKARRKRGLRESAPRTRYLTVEEEVKLLAAAKDKVAEPELHDAIVLAIDTGLRREEQFGLLRSALDWERGVIVIGEEASKNSKARDVPLLPRVRGVLLAKVHRVGSAHVFHHRKTGRRFAQLNKGLKGAAGRAGLAEITWHDLRRTCGCRLLQEHGMSMEKVSKWLGHSSIEVTQRRYAFIETSDLQRHLEDERRTEAGTGKADYRREVQ